jgi:UDP-N-acetylmuramate dehydrogenase
VTALSRQALTAAFGKRLQENVLLAPFTSARIGGPADALVTVKSADELAEAIALLRELELPYLILGGGSNLLVSDRGVRGVVVHNRARAVRFDEGEPPSVWAESGAVLSNLAQRAAAKGLSGLEWAATVPGTVGGAVYGNAGAFGGEMANDLLWAEVLTGTGRERWSAGDMGYAYRSSRLKRSQARAVILAARLRLGRSTPSRVKAQVALFSEKRKGSQPPGASMGSMFKNPEGDYAGRLIEAAGLKGARIGNAEISQVHANFFVNHGETRAADVAALIELARQRVAEQFGVNLELEIELVGEW